MGKILSYKHGEKSVRGVDPRLWDSVQHAIAAIPYDAVIRSGSESRGTSDKGNHMEGYAIDVTLYDPQTGQKLPDTVKASNHGESFAAYEQLAQATRVYQQQAYPELDKTLRWGGGFHQGGTPGDLMHLDITPSAKGSMAYYSWDTGLTSSGQKAFPNAKSNGGLSGDNGTRLVSSYKQSLAGSGGLVPPANVGSSVPLPRPRPQTGMGALGATAGSVSAGALGNTSTLGWDPQYGHTTAGETIRGVQSPADYARARLTAGNPANLDPRLMSLGQPANAMGLGASAVGGAIPAAPVPMNRPIAPVIAPTPMAGRPAALSAVPSVAKPVIPATPPAQTIRVGKHDYVIGQTFDQGGRHYIVTPSGIESSSIPTGEPTVMSGIIGSVIKSEAPKIGQSLNAAAGKATHDLGNMGTNIGTATTRLGTNIGNTLGSTLSGAGNLFGSMFNTKAVGGGVSAGGLGSAGTTGALGTATLAAQPRPTLVASGGIRTAPGLTGSSWLKAPGVMTATGATNAGTGVGGLASLVGGAAAAPVIKPVAVAAPKNKPAPVVAVAPKAATVTGSATGRSYTVGSLYKNATGTYKAVGTDANGNAKFAKVG